MATLLDDFNRANENPLTSSTWQVPIGFAGSGNLKVLSNRCVGNTNTTLNDGLWKTSYAADQEAQVTCITIPSSNRYIRLYGRINALGDSTPDGYMIQWENGANRLRMFTLTAGATAQIGSASVTLANNDVVRFELIGSTLKVYQNGSAVLTVTDSTFSNAGYIGTGVGDTTAVLDDFSGGATAQTISAPFISSGTTLFAPTLAGPGITAPFISSTTTMFAPTVTPSGHAPITAPFISSGTTVYAPSLGNYIVAPFIARTGSVFTPTMVSSGTGAISAPFIPSSTTIYTPGVFRPTVSHGIGGQDATAITFYIDHLDHDGDVIATFQPINLRWTFRLGQDGPGEIFYGIALSDPALTRDGFAPYATDFLLRVDITDGVSTNSYDLMAGPHTPVNMKLVDGTIEGVVWASGKDWLHWLDQPYTSWDYDTPIDQIVADLDPNELHGIYSAANGDTIQDVVLALLEPLSEDASEQIILTPEFNGTAFAETVDYVLWRTDGTNVSDHMKTLAHLQDPKGFDFWVEPDKTLKFFGPHRMNPNFVTPVFSFGAAWTGDEEFNPLVAIDWTNNGPLATKTIGLGNGQSNTTRYSVSTYQPSVDLYRRWTRFADLTDTTVDADAQHQVDALTDMRGYLDRFPQKELRITVKPEFCDPSDAVSMFLHQCAAVIDVDFDFAPYHRIDAEFYITSQEFYTDAAGNMLCDLTLDQIYA